MMFVRRVHPNAILPTRAHDDDVGYDLTLVELAKTFDNGVQLYDTGLQILPPEGFYVEIVPRSSMSRSYHMLANSVGIIDPGYRGNVLVALRKTNPLAPDLKLPNTIVQAIVRKRETPRFVVEVDELPSSARGDGGFGSTDYKK